MKAERDKLKRLMRLEQIRAIAKRTAAAEAAEAESTLAQLNRLSDHTGELAKQYGPRLGASNGAALRHQGAFVRELRNLSAITASDASRAQVHADGKMAELAVAERRRAVVEERTDKQKRKLTKPVSSASSGARRGFGTGLE